MAYFNILLFAYIMVQVTVSTPASPSCQCPFLTPLAKNINDFGLQLSRKLDMTGNQIFSPFSLYSAIIMLYPGAKHNTKTEIEHVLQLSRDCLIGPHMQYFFKALLKTYLENDQVGYTFETANGIFVQRGFPLKQKYVDDLKTFDEATVMQLDFAHAGSAAKDEINNWVSEHTDCRINEILTYPPNQLTKMMVLNAVYFKGAWKTPFPKKFTSDEIFFKYGGEKKTVKMMHIPKIKDNFLFFEDHHTGYKYLELPYKGDDIVMLLALPRSAKDFPFMPLSSSDLCGIFARLESKSMDMIAIPKFRLQFHEDLTGSLIALGFRNLFSGTADLTGISDGHLYLSSVIHKALIDVNEKGTEAAAVSVVTMHVSSPHSQRVVFQADHPFLFYIVDKRNGLVLFYGRVTDP